MNSQYFSISFCNYCWVHKCHCWLSFHAAFAKRSRRFLAQELENVWLFRHCTSEQKFKSIFWIFPVKTKMQMNLFDFTCQDTKFKSTLSKHKFKSICLNFHFKAKNSNQFAGFFLSKHRYKWIHLILPVKTKNSTKFSEFFLSKKQID